ncbi:tRNA wybutosine-synthesizing protein 3 homolog isoform X5 [Callithrix jacchus]|uniref:tRNA wybutosine-synthesizing protein 3 homolog isoform X5 n=1 Tax=Callithrix jacchus TaxID=9483 RepID=UPI00159DE856|nr:tRNA wybutosine-synthesizing protein 3 homolog isoform X5 [Callithrix jacchus]
MDRIAEFRKWKVQCLSKADLSRKGSVDEDVVELVQFLNMRDQFFTTSSCAGRILLLDGIVALKKANGDATLKFEPFVLHVQCRQLQDAQILAVRSTHGLEVPLIHKGKLMVTEEYIDFLLNVANQKMEENKKRIERFYNCLQHALERETMTNLHPKIKEKNNSSYTYKKQRNQEKARSQCITKENVKELENDDDDVGINITIFPEDY